MAKWSAAIAPMIDEEFYASYLLLAHNEEEFLALGGRWGYVYNLLTYLADIMFRFDRCRRLW